MSGDDTWGVAELHEAINELFADRFGPTIWVTGELRSLNRSTRGHTYFDLVEPDPGSDYGAAKLSVTLFAGRRRRLNTQIRSAGGRVGFEDGTILRIRGELRTYGSRSVVQLLMTDIDPAHTLGVVAQRRDAVLAALAAEDLLARNATRMLAHPPTSLAVVTSRGSAAEADVLHELDRCGIGFRVSCIDTRTQGRTPSAASWLRCAPPSRWRPTSCSWCGAAARPPIWRCSTARGSHAASPRSACRSSPGSATRPTAASRTRSPTARTRRPRRPPLRWSPPRSRPGGRWTRPQPG
ncbi:MAG: exodeoxyribonuclease VII large subunit [Microthrixaceae bacterium]